MKTIRKNKRNTKREKKSRKKSNKHKNTRRKNIKKKQRGGMMGVLQPPPHPEHGMIGVLQPPPHPEHGMIGVLQPPPHPEHGMMGVLQPSSHLELELGRSASMEEITQQTDILKFFKEEVEVKYKLNRDTVNIISAHGFSLNEFFILPPGMSLYLTSSGGECAYTRPAAEAPSAVMPRTLQNVRTDGGYIRIYRGGSVIQNIKLIFNPFYFDDSRLVRDDYTPRGLLNYKILPTKLSTPIKKRDIHPFLVLAITSRMQVMNEEQHIEAIRVTPQHPPTSPRRQQPKDPLSTFSSAILFYAIEKAPVYSEYYPGKLSERGSLRVNRWLEIGEVVQALQTRLDSDGDIHVNIRDGWIKQNGVNGPNIKRIKKVADEVGRRKYIKREHLQKYKDQYFKDNDESIIHSNELIESLINAESYKLSDVLRNIVVKKGVNESNPADWFGLFCRTGEGIDTTEFKKCNEKEFEDRLSAQGVDLSDNVLAHYTQHSELDDEDLFRQTSLSSSHYLTRFMENLETIRGSLETGRSHIGEVKISRFREIYENKIRGQICPVLTKSDICFILQLYKHIETDLLS